MAANVLTAQGGCLFNNPTFDIYSDGPLKTVPGLLLDNTHVLVVNTFPATHYINTGGYGLHDSGPNTCPGATAYIDVINGSPDLGTPNAVDPTVLDGTVNSQLDLVNDGALNDTDTVRSRRGFVDQNPPQTFTFRRLEDVPSAHPTTAAQGLANSYGTNFVVAPSPFAIVPLSIAPTGSPGLLLSEFPTTLDFSQAALTDPNTIFDPNMVPQGTPTMCAWVDPNWQPHPGITYVCPEGVAYYNERQRRQKLKHYRQHGPYRYLDSPNTYDVWIEGGTNGGHWESGVTEQEVETNTANGSAYVDPGLTLPGRKLLLDLRASYNSQDAYTGPLGIGWTHTYNILLIPNSGGAAVKEGDGQEIPFNGSGPGVFTPGIPGVLDALQQNPDSTYTLTRRNHVQLQFSPTGQLTSITEPNGNIQTLTYTSGNLTTVTDNSGRTLQFTYNANNQITAVSDPLGRTEDFAYDGFGRLITYTDALGGITQYAYDANNHMIQETDPRGNAAIQLTYDSENRVVSRTDALGFVTTYAYNTPSTGITTKTDPLGNVTLFAFDAQGRISSITNALGGVSSVTYNSNNMVLSGTDPRGNTWQFAYDASSDLTQTTDPLGNVFSYTYDSTYDLLTATDPLSHTTSYTYDTHDNLIQVRNAAAEITGLTYDPTGLPLTLTNPNGAVTSYTYDSAGDLIQITDALGNVWKRTYDAAGRPISFTDPLSYTTTVAYDNLNDVTSITDPLSHSTVYTYDANTNLTSVTDANGNLTKYSYDARNELSTTTDALNDIASGTYDADGNLVSYTDPAGHAMNYVYDALNRRIKATDPLGNSNLFAYDADGNIDRFHRRQRQDQHLHLRCG